MMRRIWQFLTATQIIHSQLTFMASYQHPVVWMRGIDILGKYMHRLEDEETFIIGYRKIHAAVGNACID